MECTISPLNRSKDSLRLSATLHRKNIFTWYSSLGLDQIVFDGGKRKMLTVATDGCPDFLDTEL